MPQSQDWVDQFVAHLETLRERQDRGALAALRRGLGSPPGTVPSVYPHILPWVPHYRKAEHVCYMIGSLFALHPQPGGTGTVGEAFSKVKNPSDSLEKRFLALLNCHPDDLPNHLRQAVSVLKAKDVPIDWRRLLRDVLNWDHETHFVQQQWAREFWQREVQDAEVEEEKMETS